MRLAGKVALITGAGSGIGRCAAQVFASNGAMVVVAEISEAAGRETVALIEAEGNRAIFVATDVTRPESVRACVDETLRAYGALHVLYNNAGGSSATDGPVTEAPIEEFWRAINVDLFGTYLGCRFAIPAIIGSGGGSVINAASVAALIGRPNCDGYTAAKGAIVALTRSMATEFAPHGVRVNAIAPARTLTERIKSKASDPKRAPFVARHLLGMPEPIDIANAALYLASDEARKVTGHVLAVDSGVTMS